MTIFNRGCENCPNRPGTSDEWAMAKQDPSTYCPDAYGKDAPKCGMYDHSKENTEVGR